MIKKKQEWEKFYDKINAKNSSNEINMTYFLFTLPT